MLDSAQAWHWLLRDKYQQTGTTPGKVDDLADVIRDQVRHDWQRIQAGEPLAYVIGWQPFLGCKIDLSLRPLIPRPETEAWVAACLPKISAGESAECLDLCCGSGCIGLAVLKHVPHARVDFVDLDPACCEQTRRNLHLHQWQDRGSSVWQSDLFAQVPAHRYDWMLSNPPYIDRFGEYSSEILHEPDHALFAQKNGFELIERIIQDAQKWIKPTGTLVIEYGQNHTNVIKKTATECGWMCTFHRDQFGSERWVEMNIASPKLKNR